MPHSLKRATRLDAHVAAEMAPFRTVPMPVDVTDAEQFPEIAAAIEWARKQKGAGDA